MKLRNRVFCIFLAITICFYQVTFMYKLEVVYAYESDDNLTEWLIEYVKQRNVVSQVYDFYQQYQKTGLSSDTVWEMAKNSLSNVYVDSQAFFNSAKNSYKNMTDLQKWNLINVHDLIGDVNVNVDVSLFKDLDLDLLSNNTYYQYNDPVYNYSIEPSAGGFVPITYREFSALVSSAIGVPPLSKFSSAVLGQCKYVSFYTFSNSAVASGGVASFGRTLFSANPLPTSPTLVIKPNYIDLVGSSIMYRYTHDLWGIDDVDCTTSISNVYHATYLESNNLACLGRYYVYSGIDVGDLAPEAIFNNITYNNVYNLPAVPYTSTPNYEPNGYLPTDPEWWDNLYKIITGLPVEVKTVEIPPMPTTPTPTPTPTPVPNPSPSPRPTDPGDRPTFELPKDSDNDFSIWDAINGIVGFFGDTIGWLFDKIASLFSGFLGLLKDLFVFLFVPSEEFWQEAFNGLLSTLKQKLPYEKYVSVVASLADIAPSTRVSLTGVEASVMGVNQFDDFTFALMGVEVTLPWAEPLNRYAPTIRIWLRGFFYLLLVYYDYRQTLYLIRGSHPVPIGKSGGKD